MANARILWVLTAVVLMMLIIETHANIFTCPGKIKEDCTMEDYDKGNDDDKRVYCCTYLAYERCVKRSAEKHCPGTPVSGLISLASSVDTGYCTEKYSFWSPECIYTNYLLWLIGTSAGIAALAVGLCLVCYCCCCRRK